ncbi:FMN-dependent NADH-azoreductase [Providencia alcalifaciens]|uniref:FMN-dependent NADH-azoreductase n=1 Tax=Providencia alcalifaciens TaxID=126385 RepID=UPI001CC48CF4|nr:FMN-dependent NADH-azoreductase [Providencia alcalifaciens]CAG9415921.1 FMN-dependent NADH-azoreductase [Providencia alcalifaciens]CAG9419986.1 FMN-dependent NADH-azoreductase [Providencia alcalifaciens]CAG9420986.1 FMN-dependent NADH-azoreductase [Providencia alcalifaciens]CAG9421044.1 FMN-dependent NADH-azoreductase [Providencia alcalifaciens]CAG9421152.1 FMN-dependent NADH-azoreductase [Providencia alcalifaciens]
MSKVLLLKSSILADYSHSNKMADYFVQQWKEKNPTDEFLVRDLVKQPIPAINGEILAAFAPTDTKTAQQQALLDLSNQLIDEIKQSDVLVITAPMYNFSVPSQLKHYFDFIARSGHTFKYTEQGSVGLLNNKRAYVLTSRGGIYKDTPTDIMVPYITLFLNFIGITDIEFIFAEGTALGAESVENAHSQARDHMNTLIA